MLQQTQVATVVPYYRSFLKRFPDVKSLARAREEEVLAAWSGLGYYRRARNLHASARRIVADLGGKLPQDAGVLRRLPGIGRYTAGALASIAFDRPEPALDGNTERVLSRLLGLRGDPGTSPARKRLEEAARTLLAAGRPSEITQGLMELGALVCSPSGPACPTCPVRSECRAWAVGAQEAIPERKPGRGTVKRDAAVAILRKGRRFLLVRRRDGELMSGLWEFPGDILRRGEEAQAGLRRVGRRKLARPIKVGKEIAAFGQTITYRRIRVSAYEAVLAEPAPAHWALPPDARWVSRSQISGLPHGSATARLLAVLDAPSSGRRSGGRRQAGG